MPAPIICPACGEALSAWRQVPASDPALGIRHYELYRCAACGTAVTGGEAPKGMHDAGAYAPGAPRLQAPVRPLLRHFDRRRLSLISRLSPPPGRLLDVGAGRGRFVVSATAAGYDASGIEPSLRGWQASNAQGADVTRARIEEVALTPGSLDVVSLWHVLEHLEDPAGALARVAGWLRPGGVALIGVPNLASLQARLGGGRWYHLDVPRHRVHFTPEGLGRLLAGAGLHVERSHHVLLEHNPFGMWQSLVSRVTRHPSYLYHLLKRNTPARSTDLLITLAALPLAPPAAALEWLAGAAGRGGTIAIVGRRAE